MRLRIAARCGYTAGILRDLLLQAGARLDDAAYQMVCWGLGTDRTPALNGECSTYNKLQQLQVMQRVGLPVPPFAVEPEQSLLPAFVRQLRHSGGTDIRPCFVMEDAQRFRSPETYFTRFVPSVAEYRIWVYRRRHLGTYRKVLAHPEKLVGFGRNYANGYAFELVRSPDVPRIAVDLAAQAVTALRLDFGAVDILQTVVGEYALLEVNTAPGVEGHERQVIRGLARRIARWQALGYPQRSDG